MRPRRRLRRLSLAVLLLACGMGLAALALDALDALIPLPLARLSDLSVGVTDRDGGLLRLFANREGVWRLPLEAGDVAPAYLDLLFAYEDRRFHQHWGVDPLALGRAVLQNLAAGRVVSGASTLTMQVVRLLEPHPRTLAGKLGEILRALQLEAHFDKPTILSMYLTLAPFGGPLKGLRAASRSYFAKEPRALTLAEAALLVALPQAPSRLRPDRAAAAAAQARAKVLERAREAGVITPRQQTEALVEPVPTAMHPPPHSAPHLAEELRRRHPGQTVLRSTLDGSLQAALEALARRETLALTPHAGLAILVADNRNARIIGHIGAPEYAEEARSGWIDLTRALRSPGSTLKPFVYGLGFDDGVAHPDSLVADVSTRFGDYAPGNFDKGFHGEMTIREALQRSLNVPAVLVLDRIGPARFALALTRAGVTLHLPKGVSEPGLPLALGGVALSLWDLTSLYVALAQGGLVTPLSAEPPAGPPAEPVRLMSEGAAAEILSILEQAPPPPGIVPALEAGSKRAPLAVKTGTSYGFRDAWAFGVSARYTVGVWVGRPDGTPSPDQYGRNTAAPIVYRVMDLLPSQNDTQSSSIRSAALPPRLALPPRPPELLRRLEAGRNEQRPLALPDPDRLRLVFPSAGMVVEVQSGTETTPLTLSASGGRRPLSWIVNGRPLPASPIRRDVQWQPDGPGFARVTVLDADGRSASAEFELR